MQEVGINVFFHFKLITSVSVTKKNINVAVVPPWKYRVKLAWEATTKVVYKTWTFQCKITFYVTIPLVVCSGNWVPKTIFTWIVASYIKYKNIKMFWLQKLFAKDTNWTLEPLNASILHWIGRERLSVRRAELHLLRYIYICICMYMYVYIYIYIYVYI